MKDKMKFKMDFVSSETLNDKPQEKRISFILSKVRDGSIVVTDGVLKPEEEMELIKETMRRVDDGFPGIEVCSLKRQTKGVQMFMERFNDQAEKFQSVIGSLTGKPPVKSTLRTGITLIGPAKFIKKVKKNPNSFSVLTEV
jgi:hypothetical protein